ncbi:hypothetical protein MASR1M66_05850 [Aminivibrio sp.]
MGMDIRKGFVPKLSFSIPLLLKTLGFLAIFHDLSLKLVIVRAATRRATLAGHTEE